MYVNQQKGNECSLAQQAAQNSQRELTKAKINKTFGKTSTANAIFAATIDVFLEEVKEYCKISQRGRAVRSTEAATAITAVTPEKAVAITAQTALSSVFAGITNYQAIVYEIGQQCANENKMAEFKAENPAYYNKAIKNLNSRSAKSSWKLVALTHVFAQNLDFKADTWTHSRKAHTGQVLLEIFAETTGLIEFHNYIVNGKNRREVVATKELLKIVEDISFKLSFLHPQTLPMVAKPKAWKSIYGGGYLTENFKHLKLIKNNSRSYLEKLFKHNMPIVYGGINHQQNTGFRINSKVYDVFDKLWEEGNQIAELPNREDEAIPPYPFPEKQKGDTLTEEEQKIVKLRNAEAFAIHKRNIQKRSIRSRIAAIHKIATQFKGYEIIYFPCQFDFRGRIYPIPIILNYQGSDLTKGLLEFAEGKKIYGDDKAIKWLKIQGANSFGYDKASYQDRIKWVEERTNEICSIAQNPLENRTWADADKPFEFLAFCFEYDEFLKNPEVFKTHLPIQLDGTANGLQHYNALLRDIVGGKAVNLINSDTLADIYNEVAEKLKIRLKGLADAEEMAKKWLELNFDRKLTKRPVMVLPYGGSPYSCREYIEEYLKENYSIEYLWRHFNIGKTPNECMFQISKWLAKELWGAIKDTLGSAIEGMDFLKKIASIVSKYNQYIEWQVPSGLIVRQRYSAHTKKYIRTELYGKILKATFNFDTDKLDKKRQKNGICANFIHSLDAACLMIYLNKCKAAGINSVMSIHDCYATLATDTETSARLLREAFVEIYRQPILENFVSDIKKLLPEGVELPQLPRFGELDVNEVLNSQYFFN